LRNLPDGASHNATTGKSGYFKLKCKKEYVSVAALRGGMGCSACRRTTGFQSKKTVDNQEEKSQ